MAHDVPGTPDDVEEVDDLLVVRPRPRPQLDTEIDITPMIDMVFLLLIFFLVTSSLSQKSEVRLPEAVHGDAVDAKEAVIITVNQDDAGNISIYKGDGLVEGSRVQAADFIGQEDELVDYIERELAGPPHKQYVLVKAAGQVAHGQISRVYAAAGRAAPVGKLYIAVIEAR